ncbi:hypothetical protein YC2023_010172 [Brassica napus]
MQIPISALLISLLHSPSNKMSNYHTSAMTIYVTTVNARIDNHINSSRSCSHFPYKLIAPLS